MANIYGGIDLIGGGLGAIDKINGSVLNDKDMFFTIKDGIIYLHWLDVDSGAAEDSPFVISPDLNAGNKRWLLVGVYVESVMIGNNWRFIESGESLLVQKNIDSVWTTMGEWSE